MKAPIKERIVVLRYKRITSALYGALCDELKQYLRDSLPDVQMAEERLYQPNVSFPAPPVGEKEPDWSQLKVSLDRPSRFWNVSHDRCIQLFRDCFTVNLITKPSSSGGNFNDLCAFFMRIAPFLKKHSKSFEELRFSLDYVNQFKGSQLNDFLEKDGDTLSVGKLINTPVLGPTIPGMSFRPPVEQHLNYGPDTESGAASRNKVFVSISIPEPKPAKNWLVNVTFRAEPLRSAGLLKDEDMAMVLSGMHESVRSCFKNVFAQYALDKMELSE